MAQDKAVLITGIVAVIAAVIALVASLGGLGFTGLQITDNQSRGNATLEVTQNLEINFTNDTVNWSSGRADVGDNAVRLDTKGTVINSTEDPFNNVDEPLVLRNIGNVNATINLSAGSDASNFIGGGQESDAPTPEYNWNVSSNDNEAGACQNAAPSSYTSVDTSSDGIKVCDPLKFGDSNDEMALGIEIVVPYDAPVESKTDTITATATASS